MPPTDGRHHLPWSEYHPVVQRTEVDQLQFEAVCPRLRRVAGILVRHGCGDVRKRRGIRRPGELSCHRPHPAAACAPIRNAPERMESTVHHLPQKKLSILEATRMASIRGENEIHQPSKSHGSHGRYIHPPPRTSISAKHLSPPDTVKSG